MCIYRVFRSFFRRKCAELRRFFSGENALNLGGFALEVRRFCAELRRKCAKWLSQTLTQDRRDVISYENRKQT